MIGKNELLGIFYDVINAKKFAQDKQGDLLRNPIWITFRTFLVPFEVTKLLQFTSQFKELNRRALFPL